MADDEKKEFNDSKEESIEDIVEELKNKKEEKIILRQKSNENKKVKIALFAFLIPLFLLSFYYNYSETKKMNETVVVTDEEKISAIKNYIYLTNTKIEAFRRENGVLPNSLEDLMMIDSLISYTIINDSSYSLHCKYENAEYTYKSSDDAEMLLDEEMLNELNKSGGAK